MVSAKRGDFWLARQRRFCRGIRTAWLSHMYWTRTGDWRGAGRLV